MNKTVITLGIATIAALGYSVIPTYFNKLVNPKVLHNLDSKKEIALTFDDGPDRRFTEELLNILEKNNVKATFFVVGKKAEQNPKLIQRMISDGHSIGIHSYEHSNALLKGYSYTKADFKKCKDFADTLKIKPKYFRPPWGHSNIFTGYFARKNGFKLITWNVMAQDWKANTSAYEIAQKLLRRVHGGSIICLHDSGGAENAPERTLEALKRVIPILKDNGFEFTALC